MNADWSALCCCKRLGGLLTTQQWAADDVVVVEVAELLYSLECLLAAEFA